MEKEDINKEELKKEMEETVDEEFKMSEEEAEEAKKGGFNPFWSTNKMEKDKMIEQLHKLPKFIKERDLEILDKTMKIDEFVLQLKTFEKNTAISVENEVDEGKKVFSNKLQRDVELENRLRNDIGFNEIKEKHNNAKNELKTEIVEVEFLKRRFRSLEAVSRIGE